MKQKPSDVHLSFDHFTVQAITDASGLFFDGPHQTNHWQSTNKINRGLSATGHVPLKNVRSVLKDNDHIDYF